MHYQKWRIIHDREAYQARRMGDVLHRKAFAEQYRAPPRFKTWLACLAWLVGGCVRLRSKRQSLT